MTNNDIENGLKNAVERLTPSVLGDIADKYGERAHGIYVMQPKRRGYSRARAMAAAAAALVLAFTGLFAYNHIGEQAVDALVTLDVNPSIELKINKNERVLGVEAKNEDAVIILDNMDLTNTHINVAVNALVGSMLKFGYIHENANSVLLSVEGNDHERSVLLQRSLANSISQHINVAGGAVISQALQKDGALELMAQEHQISYGKAALIQAIVSQNSHLLFEDLAQLSVNELNLLLTSRRVQAQGVEAQGAASDAGYIGEARALQIALEHAGISGQGASTSVEMDYDGGRMVYDVEFNSESKEYEYEIDAVSGGIISWEEEDDNKRDGDDHGDDNDNDDDDDDDHDDDIDDHDDDNDDYDDDEDDD